MKSFLKSKRFWLTVLSALSAAISGLVDDPNLREGILAAVAAIMTYVLGLFGVEIKRTTPGQ